MSNQQPLDLQYLNISSDAQIHYQMNVSSMIENALKHGEGLLAETGALTADTGKFTGRSPKDRFIVKDNITAASVDWGEVNQPISRSVYGHLVNKLGMHLSKKTLYVRDVTACADPNYQLSLRVVTETAYQNIFVNNMFIRTQKNNPNQRPEWSILAGPSFFADPESDGVPSPNFVIINFTDKVILIAGTGYTGEIKKAIFSVLNYVLPYQQNVLSMHCSANTDKNGNTALFFGLSGTGKTTLSSDSGRYLIGDDEHGWGKNGIFNFEGGCYAKCVNLDEEQEPDIFKAVRFGALLENINFHKGTRIPNYQDISKTENTRVAYPIDFIEGSVLSGQGSIPKNIFFLTADAFGVLPPVSLLTPAQAMYHFISGYTSKVAGTEVGVTEPRMVFSPCFAQAFIPLHPSVYASMLGEKLRDNDIDVWLINTGWVGGPYGVGRRINLNYTRAIVRAALNGQLKEESFKTHPVFRLDYPSSCPLVPDKILDPVKTWSDKDAYYSQANKLAAAFNENFKKYECAMNEEMIQVAPRETVSK